MGFTETVMRLVMAMVGTAPMASNQGMATRFGEPGDPLNGGAMYCTKKKMQPGELACAHRTLPCGTVLLIENVRNGKLAMCTVSDRGPYGAIGTDGRWKIKRTKRESGTWRGILDMSPTVVKALGHRGFEKVRIFYPKTAVVQAAREKAMRRERQRRERAEHQRIEDRRRRLRNNEEA